MPPPPPPPPVRAAAPSPAEPALPVCAGAGGISLPQQRRRQRPGPAPRARAPTSLAHPPRGGRDGMGGRAEFSRDPQRVSAGIFKCAGHDPSSGGGGLRTTNPGMPRSSHFRSRPGGCLSWGTPGAVVPGPARAAPGKARSWPAPCTSWEWLCSPALPRGNPGREKAGPAYLCPSHRTHFSPPPSRLFGFN